MQKMKYKNGFIFLFFTEFCGENVYICCLNPINSDSLCTKIKLLKEKDKTLKWKKGQKRKNNRYTINFSSIIRKELFLYSFLVTS